VTELRDYIAEVLKVASGELSIRPTPERPSFCLDTQKFASIFDWKPQHTYRDLVDSLVEAEGLAETTAGIA
jgi:hypothetical protein